MRASITIISIIAYSNMTNLHSLGPSDVQPTNIAPLCRTICSSSV